MTVADKAIERALCADIEDRFPEHGIFGEETGMSEGDGRTWVLDPIYDTKSFITGMPLFGALIAFVDQDRPQLGIFCDVVVEASPANAGTATIIQGELAAAAPTGPFGYSLMFKLAPGFKG